MKTLIMVLTLSLAFVVFTIQVSKIEATSFHIHELTYQDYDGTVIQTDFFVEGADLSNHLVLEPPTRVGYVFVGWTQIDVMPGADVIIIAQYMETGVLVTTTI